MQGFFCFWIFDRGFVSARDHVFYGCLGTAFSFLQKVVFLRSFLFRKRKEPCSSVNGTAETAKGYNVSFFDTKERDAKKPPKGD
jgi:hypothetical protein